MKLFGRWVDEPRLTAWYSDPGVYYHYSGKDLHPVAWPMVLGVIKSRLETFTGERFNAVLCNYYRHGEDYMGWHSDDETSLGKQPVIASLSLGAKRDFVLRRKNNYQDKLKLELQHGSLLLMRGRLQSQWQHSLPKRKNINSARVNLTFRVVMTKQ